MSASSSDSWILIALTILVVSLLFYLSKKMICNSPSEEGDDRQGSDISTSTTFTDYLSSPPPPPSQIIDGESSQDLTGDEVSNASSPHLRTLWEGDQNGNEYYCGHHQHHPLASYDSSNGASWRTGSISVISSRKELLEGQLQLQLGKIVNAEKEIQRLAQLLAMEEGIEWQPDHEHLSYNPTLPGREATVSPNDVDTQPSSNADDGAHYHQDRYSEESNGETASSSAVGSRLHSQSFPLLSSLLLGNSAGRNVGEFPPSRRPPYLYYHPLPYNLCRAANYSESRRMLLLHRMLLPPGIRREFLVRECLPYSNHDRATHYSEREDGQSSSHHGQRLPSNDDELGDGPPPPYEECIKEGNKR